MSILEIELTPDMEQRLGEKARRLGQETKAYLQNAVKDNLSQEEEAAVTGSQRRFNFMAFYGVGRDAWKGVAVQEYINEMRDEWEA